LKIERESQFNTAGGSEFQVRGAAVLKDRLARQNIGLYRPNSKRIAFVHKIYAIF